MSKKHKKDKKSKRDRKDRSDKKRKREDNSSDSEEEEAQKRVDREVQRLTKALTRGATEPVPEDGEGQTRFVWKKKIEKELQGGARARDIYAREKRNTEAERKAEIEKVQRRREERELEKEQREREQEQLLRDRSAAEAFELEKKEDEFHLENAKARAQHRLKEGRGKPVDSLIKDLLLNSELEVGAEPPYHVFNGLSYKDKEELREDIIEFQELDSQDPEHAAWWECLVTICDEELQDAALQDESDRTHHRNGQAELAPKPREIGMHTSVGLEIQSLLSGQRYGELVKMEEELKQQLEANTAPDPEFFSAILRRMVLHKAKARLREIHGTLLARSLARGEKRINIPVVMGWREEYLYKETDQQNASPELHDEPSTSPQAVDPEDAEEPDGALPAIGQWSPAPLEPDEYAGEEAVPEEEDLHYLQLLRIQVKQKAMAGLRGPDRTPQTRSAGAETSGRQLEADTEDESTRRLRHLAARSMGDINESGDAPFGGEVEVESRVYWWHQKYRPRKPKYFNRVHTGYEWNKYNQTHYDHDNPPPKVVQGYKFNIFYPDLIDKKTAPEYSVEADPEADEFGSTCVLRFQAGPPYEDLTFRILNREWEYSHKKGFKCVFDRDTLYLYFNFKRQRYRR